MFPRMPCSNNRVVIHPSRCQEQCVSPLQTLVSEVYAMLGIYPLTKQRVKQWSSLSLFPLFISGGWVGFFTGGQNHVQHLLIYICASEKLILSVVKQNRQTGYHCWFSPPWPLKPSIRSNVSSTQSLDTSRFIFLSLKDDSLYHNKLPCVLLCHCGCQSWQEKYTVYVCVCGGGGTEK